MIVYHGSKEKFNVFDYSRIGLNGTSEGVGFYFSSSRGVAESYGENGYVYTVKVKGKKPLNYYNYTITKDQLWDYLYELDKINEYLSNWGEVAYSGLNRVLTDAVEGEYGSSDNDVDLISGICHSSGDTETCLKLLYEMYGYDHIVIEDAEWGKGQTIYVALINDIIEIIDIEEI